MFTCIHFLVYYSAIKDTKACLSNHCRIDLKTLNAESKSIDTIFILFFSYRKMKKIILIIAILAITSISFAQTSLKIYNQFSNEKKIIYNNHDAILGVTTEGTFTQTTLFHLTLAVQWKAKKKKNFHQFELNNFQVKMDDKYFISTRDSQPISRATSGEKINHIHFAVRYEYLKHLISDKKLIHQFYLGYGINPFFDREQSIPNVSNEYPMMFASAGIRLFLTPRYIFHISKKFYTDINIPIAIANVNYDFVNIKNPTLPLLFNQQRYSVFNLDVLPHYLSARISIGIKL